MNRLIKITFLRGCIPLCTVSATDNLLRQSPSIELTTGQDKAKPNILLIMADDLGYHDLSCQGVKDFKTPNIDRLAASGVRFTAGYVTAPQCGPSRAGMLTGMHQSRFGCTDNRHDFGLPPKTTVQILPEQLKARGYTTGIIGKWHIGFEGSEKTGHGTRPGHHPWERGFDYVLKHHGGMSHFFPYRQDGWKWMTDRKREPRLQQKLESDNDPTYLEGLPEGTYLTDIFSERAVDFVTRHKSKDPWFLFLSYNAPHTPIMAPKDKMAKYAHIKVNKRRTLAAMMDSLDDGVGRVLKALEDSGQRENTIVWFLSDNGGVAPDSPQWNGSRNDPFSGAKGDVFEGGIRVPFMVSWPGTIPAGKVVDDPVISLDILPTSLAAAGQETVPEIHDGKNLLPWLMGKSKCPNDELFWSWRGNYNAIRVGNLKEIRNGKPVTAVDGTPIPARNVVDLATNPMELGGRHVLRDEATKAELSGALDAWLESVREDAEKLTPRADVLMAGDFGVLGDGETDDGPAIQAMLAEARKRAHPVELRFPENAVICIRSAVGRYVFSLDEMAGLKLNGQGSEFRLSANLRFLRAEGCSDLVVTDLEVDFLRQPTTPGTIIEVDPLGKSIDVRLDHAEMASELGGPTGEDGEQAFFGMILLEALYGTKRVFHYYVDRVEMPSPGIVRVFNKKPVWKTLATHVRLGETRVGLPVPGVAHRHGPGALFVIDGCRDVTVSHINVWSAPWFTFQLFRNEGLVSLHHVNVKPKPGSGKVLSSCRDAIHAKGNRADLLFEDCVLDGLGDDAFNISTHCSRIRSIESPTRITVAQEFPLQHIPFRPGDTLILMDPETNRKVAERSILAVEYVPSEREPRADGLSPWAPSSVLTLDHAVKGLARSGLVVWSPQSANPRSTVRRCVIRRSCRFQGNIIVEECDVEAFMWIYGAEIEGPGPETVTIRKSRLKANGLTEQHAHAVTISGWEKSRSQVAPDDAAAILRQVRIEDNEIRGRVVIKKALEAVVTGNLLMDTKGSTINFEHCGKVVR